MTHPIRSLGVAALALAAASWLAACGSSGSDASPTTTKAPATTTEPTASTTSGDDGSTTATEVVAPDAEVDCQALLQEYAEVFDPDDLTSTVAFFRKYGPAMPDDVAAATERLAGAYEDAGDLGHMDMGDVDLTADAQTFSDWTNDGCPAG